MHPPIERWSFLSNHAHVMIVLARDSTCRLRDIAREVGVTERAVQRLIADLIEVGALTRERVGRRNHYHLNRDLPLRHALECNHSIGELLDTLAPNAPNGGGGNARRAVAHRAGGRKRSRRATHDSNVRPPASEAGALSS